MLQILALCLGTTFLITPGNRMYLDIEPGDLVEGSGAANETGNVIHSAIYGARPDVRAPKAAGSASATPPRSRRPRYRTSATRSASAPTGRRGSSEVSARAD